MQMRSGCRVQLPCLCCTAIHAVHALIGTKPLYVSAPGYLYPSVGSLHGHWERTHFPVRLPACPPSTLLRHPTYILIPACPGRRLLEPCTGCEGQTIFQEPLVIWLQGGPGASGTGYGNFMVRFSPSTRAVEGQRASIMGAASYGRRQRRSACNHSDIMQQPDHNYQSGGLF